MSTIDEIDVDHEDKSLFYDFEQYVSVWKRIIALEFESSLGEIEELLVEDAGELTSNDATGGEQTMGEVCSAYADSKFRVTRASPF